MARRFAAIIAGLCLLVVAGAVAESPRAEAASPSQFDPGMLISDGEFFNGAAMTAVQVQAFLNQQAPVCSGSAVPCLKDYRQSTPSKAAVAGRCGPYAGGTNQTAAQILADVGRACGVSQKAMLVLLQKEQSLVTSTAPSSTQYRSATGYGCPDTAACDSTYYGFFNQVYMAALQFKRYAASPSSWRHIAGTTVQVYYHPNAGCGTKAVYIQNQATAGLYNYTPYTPNAAALANLYGTGDGCSSYGNRNFWRIYTDWFGSTTGDMSPFGELSTASAGPGSVIATGWAVDPDAGSTSIRTHYYVDGQVVAKGVADATDASLESAYAYYGSAHAFSVTLTGIDPGVHEVCAYGINVEAGKNALLSCRTVEVLSGAPIGRLDTVASAPDQISYRGWAYDPDSNASIRVHTYIDGVLADKLTADQPRNDVGAVYPLYGSAHGYSNTVTGVSGGLHEVCTYGIDLVAPGSNSLIACKQIAMPSGVPYGRVDALRLLSPGRYSLTGWALDPDTAASIRVHVYIDGVLTVKGDANGTRADIAAAFPGYGAAHGYALELTGISPGPHTVCAYGINVGVGSNSLLECEVVDFPGGQPVGGVDNDMAISTDSLTLTGWALDPDTIDPSSIRVEVDGIPRLTTVAGLDRADIVSGYPGYGRMHGFSVTLKIGGTHRVCVVALDTAGEAPRELTCVSPTVPTARTASDPEGALTVTLGAAGAVTMSGWAADPDADTTLRVHSYLDGVIVGDSWKVDANHSESAVGVRFPEYSTAHGFVITQSGVAAGEHEFCVYAINTGAGANALLACTRAVVR